MDKKSLGAWGEKMAEIYLKNKGYKILEKNWRSGHKEIDLIVYKEVLIAIEVKTLNNKRNLEFVILKAAQVERIRGALENYCRLHNLNYQNSRLDLIIISKDSRGFSTEHRLDI